MSENRLVPAKARLRFREYDDLALLREVLNINPLQNAQLWEAIQEHIFVLTGNNFSVKTLRDHLLLLIQHWLEKTKELKDRSGIEYDYSEKDHLCEQIHEMMGQNAKIKCVKKIKKKEENLGKFTRDKFAEEAVQFTLQTSDRFAEEAGQSTHETISAEKEDENITEHIILDHEYCSVAETTVEERHIEERNEESRKRKAEKKVLQRVRARTRRTSAQKQGLQYLENYDHQQAELKKIEQNQAQQKIDIEKEKLQIEWEKIAIKKRRLDLEEEKTNLEEYEKKKILQLLEQKFEQDRTEKQQFLKVIERQENIINILLKSEK